MKAAEYAHGKDACSLLTAAAAAAGPLASSGVPEAMQLADPQSVAQPAASILEQDHTDTSMVAVDSPVPNSRVKALRMAAATAAAERRTAAAQAVAAASADGSTDYSNVDAFQAGTMYQAILDKHNSYRAKHQAAALTWSSTLASQAASYGARCNFAHDPYANAGENLFAISDSRNPAGALSQAIDLW
jgi:hypothetical protein